MGTSEKSYTLTVEDSAIARLLVRAGPSTRGRITRVTSVVDRLMEDRLMAPRAHVVSAVGVKHHLTQSWAPDGRLTLETIEVDDAESGERWMLPADAEWSYMEWAEGSRAEAGGNLLASLPDGDYWLVRTKLRAQAPPQSLATALTSPPPRLVDERVKWPPNAIELVDERSLYAAAIGARPDALPSGKTPLVGLAVLDYVGDSVMDAALFFELAQSTNAGAPPKTADADAVVVVPAGSDLVIDGRSSFSAERSREAKERWRTTRAHALVRRLAWRLR